jgi:hypothetical protein
MFDSGPTTAAADAPLAKDKETPTTPNTASFCGQLKQRLGPKSSESSS